MNHVACMWPQSPSCTTGDQVRSSRISIHIAHLNGNFIVLEMIKWRSTTRTKMDRVSTSNEKQKKKTKNQKRNTARIKRKMLMSARPTVPYSFICVAHIALWELMGIYFILLQTSRVVLVLAIRASIYFYPVASIVVSAGRFVAMRHTAVARK